MRRRLNPVLRPKSKNKCSQWCFDLIDKILHFDRDVVTMFKQLKKGIFFEAQCVHLELVFVLAFAFGFVFAFVIAFVFVSLFALIFVRVKGRGGRGGRPTHCVHPDGLTYIWRPCLTHCFC